VYGGGVRYFTPDESYYKSEGGTASDVDAAEIEEEEEEDLEEDSEGYAQEEEEDSEVYTPEEELEEEEEEEEEDEHRGLAMDGGDSEGGGSRDSLGNNTLPYYMGSTFCGVETVHSNSTIVSFVVDGGGVGAPRRGDRVVGDSESKKKKRKKTKTKKKATRLDERAGAVVGRGGRGRGHIPEITPEKR
jgi:hypothetical protein